MYPGNWQCSPPASHDAPVDIALSNDTVGVLTGICYGLGYQYIGEREYKAWCKADKMNG